MSWNNVFAAQVEDCMVLQHTLNQQLIGEDYRNNPPNFVRAFRQEIAEYVDWTPWKWWKAMPEANQEQIKIEVVDCFHFFLSQIIASSTSSTYIAKHLYAGLGALPSIRVSAVVNASCIANSSAELQQLEIDDMLYACALSLQKDDTDDAAYLFGVVMQAIGLSWTELYKKYIAKNTLNQFRSDNGYKNGSYIKEWFGKEDNDHLMEYVNSIVSPSGSFAADCYKHLANIYSTVNV